MSARPRREFAMRIRSLRSTSAPPLEPVAAPPAEMRAMVIGEPGGPEALGAASLAVPSPVLSEVLVRVVAAGINPIDAKTRSGSGVSAAIGSYPGVLGYDFRGVVVR